MRGTRGFDELVCERLLKEKLHHRVIETQSASGIERCVGLNRPFGADKFPSVLPGHWRRHAGNTGSPSGDRNVDQLAARERRAGLTGMAERLVVPTKPGNSGGGKGPLS
jgi:hypothetical protein